MGAKYKTELRKVSAVPKGMAFIQHTLELVTSDAWRGRSINCARLIEFLEIEHMRHAGSENGHLLAPWDQLVSFGIGRRFIRTALNEAIERGLVEEIAGVRRTFNSVTATRYRLTFLPECVRQSGARYYCEPTNEWRSFKSVPVKSRNSGHEGEPRWCTKVNSDSAPSCTLDDAETAENYDPPKVHEGERLYISWPNRENLQSCHPSQTDASVSDGQAQTPQVSIENVHIGNTQKNLAFSVRKRLKVEGASQRQLAEALGVSRSQLCNRLAGRFGLNQNAESKLREYADGEWSLGDGRIAA